MEYNLTTSIVLYKPKPDAFKTIESFLDVKYPRDKNFSDLFLKMKMSNIFLSVKIWVMMLRTMLL